MEEKLQQAYLYDFYGELLNEHQRRIYEDFVFNDLFLGEIAGKQDDTNGPKGYYMKYDSNKGTFVSIGDGSNTTAGTKAVTERICR